VASANDGSLRTAPPQSTSDHDTYLVDDTTTTGDKSRWNAII
jgi:hypothetical protein